MLSMVMWGVAQVKGWCRSLWVMYDPDLRTWQEGLPLDINKTLKRRYYLVEKAKNASVIGAP